LIDGMKTRHLAPALTLLALLASAACLPPEPAGGPGARPRDVRVLLVHEPASLSLIGKPDRYGEILAAQVTDSLVQYDRAMRLVPRVAESWEFLDGNRELVIRLRPGVRWHDGVPVTAEDVVFTVEQVRLPVLENTSHAPRFAHLESVEAVDALTVRARYRDPTPDDLEGWRVPLVPKHLAGSGRELLEGSFARHPVGCGPFRFVHYRSGEEILLEANDDYWDGRPLIDRLVLRVFPDDRTAYEVLLAGGLDLMYGSPDLYRKALESQPERLAGVVESQLSVWQIYWNLDGSNPFFADPRVRRALVHALDRDRFNERIVHGLARVAATLYHPDGPWADPAVEPLPFDPARARSLLDGAGWSDADGDGVRERDGRPLRFTLMIPASTQRLNDDIAAWLQQSWSEVGAAAEIEKAEWEHYRARRNAGRFEAALGGISLTPIPDLYELLHSSQRDAMNFGAFADAEVDRLLEAGRAEFDEGRRRREIYGPLQRRLSELQPTAVLFHFPSPVLHDRRLHGLAPSPLSLLRVVEGPRLWHWVDEPAKERP
jgi:peptide/nickel transport system substrate-binding protein